MNIDAIQFFIFRHLSQFLVLFALILPQKRKSVKCIVQKPCPINVFVRKFFGKGAGKHFFLKKVFPHSYSKKSNQLVCAQAQAPFFGFSVKRAQDETSVAAHRDGNGRCENGVDTFLGLEVDLDKTAPHGVLCRLS